MRVRQIDLLRNKSLRDFKQKDKNVDLRSLSFFRMFSFYWGSNPTELEEDKHSVSSNQPSA